MTQNRANVSGQAVPPPYPFFDQVRDRLEKEKRSSCAVAIEDLVCLAVQALEEDQAIRRSWSDTRSRHRLVDGIQDAEPIDKLLLDLMASPNGSLAVTFDPNQNVSGDSQRGPSEDWPSAEAWTEGGHLLTVNHRSSELLVNAAKELATSESLPGLVNDYQGPVRSGGSPPVVKRVYNEEEADGYLLAQITQADRRGMSRYDIAVICRDQACAERTRQLLAHWEIPCEVWGVGPKALDEDLRRSVQFLESVLNPADPQTFSGAAFDAEIRSSPVARQVLRAMSRAAGETGKDLYLEASRHMESFRPGSPVRNGLELMVKAGQKLKAMLDDRETGLPEVFWNTPALLETQPGQASQEWSRLMELSAAIPRDPGEKLREHLRRFLDRLQPGLYPDVLSPSGGVTVTTVHEGRGLEWQLVLFLDAAGPDEGQPHHEHDRLRFTAITRATDAVIYIVLTHTSNGLDQRTWNFADTLERIQGNLNQEHGEAVEDSDSGPTGPDRPPQPDGNPPGRDAGAQPERRPNDTGTVHCESVRPPGRVRTAVTPPPSDHAKYLDPDLQLLVLQRGYPPGELRTNVTEATESLGISGLESDSNKRRIPPGCIVSVALLTAIAAAIAWGIHRLVT